MEQDRGPGDSLEEPVRKAKSEELDVDRWVRETKFVPPPGGEFIVKAVETFASPEHRPSNDELNQADRAIEAAAARHEDGSEDLEREADFAGLVVKRLIESGARSALDYIDELRKSGQAPKAPRPSAS